MISNNNSRNVGAARIALVGLLLGAFALAACAEPPARSPNDTQAQFNNERVDRR